MMVWHRLYLSSQYITEKLCSQWWFLWSHYSIIIACPGLAGLASHLDLGVRSFYTKGPGHRVEAAPCPRPRGVPARAIAPGYTRKGQGGEESSVFSGKGTFDLSRPQ